MASLVLLNGPPASGKSTVATRLVERRPLALNLDIDAIRSQLGGWQHDPQRAGVTARRLAVTAARAHLQAGHDVVVPQFLGRVEFIEQLAALASDCGAAFVELMLQIDLADARHAFEARSAAPQRQTHRDAAALVAASDSQDPLGDMHAAAAHVVTLRPATRLVPTARNDIDATLDRVLAELADAKVSW